MEKDPKNILTLIAQTIYDKKGINILGLDLRGISSLADFVVIAEGNVDRHVIAIAKAILETLEEIGIKPYQVEGLQTGDWVVIDFLDYMVHLFMPGLRDKYRLEELWKEGKILDLPINATTSNIVSYDRSLRK